MEALDKWVENNAGNVEVYDVRDLEVAK